MDNTTPNTTLTLSDAAADFLATTRKWAFFLAIVGFIGAGFMVIAGLAIGALGSTFIPQTEESSPVFGLFIGLFYAALGAVYFFPSYYLLRFSTNINDALGLRSEDRLTQAFRYLRAHFTFMGVLVLAWLGIVVVGIMIAVLLALFAAANVTQ